LGAVLWHGPQLVKKKSIKTYFPSPSLENKLNVFPSMSLAVKSTAVVKVVCACIANEQKVNALSKNFFIVFFNCFNSIKDV
jgi:hypothetical protein